MQKIYIVHEGKLPSDASDFYQTMQAAYRSKNDAKADAEACGTNMTQISVFTKGGEYFLDSDCFHSIPVIK